MLNGDTDWLDGVSTYAFGNGWGMELWGSDSAGYDGYCRQQFFNNCLFGGGSVGGLSGTALGGGGSVITLPGTASAVDGYYVNKFITLTGGTGAGQVRKVSAYNG